MGVLKAQERSLDLIQGSRESLQVLEQEHAMKSSAWKG
jgi:hypothetical protein